MYVYVEELEYYICHQTRRVTIVSFYLSISSKKPSHFHLHLGIVHKLEFHRKDTQFWCRLQDHLHHLLDKVPITDIRTFRINHRIQYGLNVKLYSETFIRYDLLRGNDTFRLDHYVPYLGLRTESHHTKLRFHQDWQDDCRYVHQM